MDPSEASGCHCVPYDGVIAVGVCQLRVPCGRVSPVVLILLTVCLALPSSGDGVITLKEYLQCMGYKPK